MEPTKAEIFARFRETGRKGWQQAAEAAWKGERKRRYLASIPESMSRVPEEIQAWAWARFRVEISSGGFYHCNSFRIARAGSRTSLRRFRRERTCCGCHEFMDRCPADGLVYHLGFNFGH